MQKHTTVEGLLIVRKDYLNYAFLIGKEPQI